tara:strand:+ start:1049 stop:1873 length:825 start_codon:yes stop_codon:yes gene_type:complete
MTDINVLHKLGKEYTYHVGLTSNVSSPDSIKFKSPFENVIAVEVIQSEIPYCDYTIDTFRKTFNISGTDVELTLGDYNADQLAAELQSEIIKVSGCESLTVTVDTFMRLTFSLSGPSFTIIPGELSDILGIMKETISDSSGIIKSVHPINLKPDQIISIHCDELDSIITKGKSEDTLVTRLSEQIIRNMNVREQISVPYIRPFFPISRLSQLTLKFKRRNGTLYDFKGRSWYLKLIIQSLDMTFNEQHQKTKQIVKAPVSDPYTLPFAANYYNE